MKLYHEVAKKFAAKEGSERIASEHALQGLEKRIRKGNINNILEFGIGIGTIPYLISQIAKDEKRKINYYGTELNEFCLGKIKENIDTTDNEYFNFNVMSDVEELPSDFIADLVIIDGDVSNYEKIKDILSEAAIIFIEGTRTIQQDAIKKVYPNALISTHISLHKNPPYSPFPSTRYLGAFRTVYVNKSFNNTLNYWTDRLQTKIKYQLRKLQ
ncbi:MAG: hypothetical protein ACPGJS_20395 [Flammeovirgaceae bacterium]